MKKQPRVFFSYAANDGPFVAKLAKSLRQAGVATFDSAGGTKDGESSFATLRKELNASDAVLFVVPAHQGEGRWALAEIGAARMLDKKIIGVLRDRMRFANSSVARALSNGALIDASELSQAALATTIASNVSGH
jgi:TIR domain